MDWHVLASTPPPLGAATFELLAEYAMTFNGYEYAEEVLKVDSFEYFERCKTMDRSSATIEDLRFYLFMLQRQIRWIESGAYDEEGRREFMRVIEVVTRRATANR